MRASTVVLLVLASLAVSAAVGEPTAKQRALARVDGLIEAGRLDEAEERLEHLLAHNPGDPDLETLREKLRIRQGKLEFLRLEGDGPLAPDRRADLRAACWRVVAATVTGSPEEARTLHDAGDPASLAGIREILAASESATARRVARELGVRLRVEADRDALFEEARSGDLTALVHLPEDLARSQEALVLAALRERTPPATACDLAGRLNLRGAAPRLAALVRAGDPANRVAAAAALLAMGEPSARRVLEAVLTKGTPAEAVTALAALAERPGRGKTPRLDRLRALEAEPPRARLEGTMVDVLLGALGRSDEPGAGEALRARLRRPTTVVAAARALGDLGDDAALPDLLAALRSPPREKAGADAAAAGGLGYLGRRMGGHEVARAIDLRPRLVAAIAILRVSRPR